MRRLFALFLALSAPAAAHAQAVVYEQPITLKSETESAEIEVALSRASEREPAFFRILASDARHYMNGFQAQADLSRAEDGQEEYWQRHSLNVRYDDTLVSANFLSVLSASYEYTGGAHGNTYFESFLFDRRMKAMVSLDDLLDDVSEGAPALVAIRDAVYDDLVKQKQERWGAEEFDPEGDVFLADVRPSTDFLSMFTAEPSTEPGKIGGLTFHFAPYIVGPYAEGTFTVTVGQSVFADHLEDAYTDDFGGAPRVGARLGVTGEPFSTVAVDGIAEDGTVAQTATLTGEAPDHWFREGAAAVRFVDEAGTLGGTAELTQIGEAGEASFAMKRFEGELTIEAAVGTKGRLIFAASDAEPLKIDEAAQLGPTEASLAVVVGAAVQETATEETN